MSTTTRTQAPTMTQAELQASREWAARVQAGDPEALRRAAAGKAAFLDRLAAAAESERAKMTPARQRRNPFTSPESVAAMRADAARCRESAQP